MKQTGELQVEGKSRNWVRKGGGEGSPGQAKGTKENYNSERQRRAEKGKRDNERKN